MTTLVLPKPFWIIGAVLIVLLLACYIFQVVEVTRASFFISNYEKQISTFSQESKSLESSFSQLNSLASLESVLDGLNYVKVEKIHYIRLLSSQVAAK